MKIFKNPLFTFILGILLFGGITIIADTLNASQIPYKDTNVASALDNLYTKSLTYKNLDQATTVDAYKLLANETAYSSSGHLVTGAIQTYNVNGHVTPGSTEQSVATAGKYVDNNIIIDPIPSNYKLLNTPTTAQVNNILSGFTAYDNDGNLITGTLSTNCVKGYFDKSANSQISINFGFNPSSFTFIFTNDSVKQGYEYNQVTETIYRYKVNTNSTTEFTAAGQTISINGNIVQSNFSTAGTPYKNSYRVYYMGCN